MAVESADQEILAGIALPHYDGLQQSVVLDILGQVSHFGLVQGTVIRHGGMQMDAFKVDVVNTDGA